MVKVFSIKQEKICTVSVHGLRVRTLFGAIDFQSDMKPTFLVYFQHLEKSYYKTSWTQDITFIANSISHDMAPIGFDQLSSGFKCPQFGITITQNDFSPFPFIILCYIYVIIPRVQQ